MGSRFTKFASVTLGGDRTISNPSGGINGAIYQLEVVQDSTGGREITWGSDFKWGSDNTAPVLSTTGGAADILNFVRLNGEMRFHRNSKRILKNS